MRQAAALYPRNRGRTTAQRMTLAKSSRMVTDPAAPMCGIKVAASAPPNCTETMPASTNNGAGTRSAAVTRAG
ncbi:hypothetical protein GCM10028781_25060 [Nostocoides australiense]